MIHTRLQTKASQLPAQISTMKFDIWNNPGHRSPYIGALTMWEGTERNPKKLITFLSSPDRVLVRSQQDDFDYDWFREVKSDFDSLYYETNHVYGKFSTPSMGRDILNQWAVAWDKDDMAVEIVFDTQSWQIKLGEGKEKFMKRNPKSGYSGFATGSISAGTYRIIDGRSWFYGK